MSNSKKALLVSKSTKTSLKEKEEGAKEKANNKPFEPYKQKELQLINDIMRQVVTS